MKKHYVQSIRRVSGVLLWAGLMMGQTVRAQSVPDAQWARVGRTLAVTADGNIATTEGGMVVKYGLNGDQLMRSGLIAGTSYIGGKISGCPTCVPNVNGYAPIASIHFLAPTADGGVLLIGSEYSTGYTIPARLNANFSRSASGGSFGDYVIDTPDRGTVSISTVRVGREVARREVVVTRSSPQQSWSKSLFFAGPGPQNASSTRANAVINTPDGGFLVVGNFNEGDNNFVTGWVAKLDGQGNVSWQKLLNGLPRTNSFSGPTPGEIYAMSYVTDAIVSADGTGYALVGTGLLPGSVGGPPPATALIEIDLNGNFRQGRAKAIDTRATDAYITSYTDRSGKKYYAVGNSSLQNGVDPQILLVDPVSSPTVFNVAAKRTFEGPGDGPLTDIATAGDGGLVFVSANNQLVKLSPEMLSLQPPTYDCASGAITLNTIGGNGSAITYTTPGISRSSAGSSTGTVEPGLRSDPKDMLITATQNGVSTTYTFDLRAACGPPVPKPPLYYQLPDLAFVVGQEIEFEFGYYFLDPTGNVPNYRVDWLFDIQGLPEGLRLEPRVPYSRVPYVPILGTPTKAGVYTVSVVASTSGFRNDPIRTTFQITVSSNGQPPVTPPVPPIPPTPPSPPVTGGTLTLTQPIYDCQTGAIIFNTNGGDGSSITYNAPGIARFSLTSNTGTVEPGLRNDPKPITITAVQSGQTAVYTFDFGAYCAGPQPPVMPPVPPVPPTPPPGGALTLLVPGYDCGSGAITFRSSGGDGSLVEYAAAGITGWTANPNQFVDRDSRTANDVQPFVLVARQGAVTVTYVWDLKLVCNRARLGIAEERTEQLSVLVLGNPVDGKSAEIEIRGVANQAVQLDLVDLQGRVLHQQRIEQIGSAERVSVITGDSRGLLLLNVRTATQRQQVKLVKP